MHHDDVFTAPNQNTNELLSHDTLLFIDLFIGVTPEPSTGFGVTPVDSGVTLTDSGTTPVDTGVTPVENRRDFN